jgi:peptide/nickel transport system substrate-binding protein
VTATVTAAGWNAGIGSIVNPSTSTGGTLRLCSGAGVDSLDPARTYYVWVWLLQRCLNRTLMAYPTDATPAGRIPVPDLAVAPGQPSADRRTWTYRLRAGVRYENGEHIKAGHIAHAVRRIFAQHLLPGGPTWLIQLLDDPARPYRGPYEQAGADVPGLAAVETPDDYTIVFHLNQPFADFDHLVCQPATVPVPPEHDTGPRYQDAPLCSGPYRIAEHRPGASLSLVRNEFWDRSSDPVRPALPDRIEVTMGMTPDELDQRLIAGEFDLNLEGRGIQHAAQRSIMADEQLRSNSDNPLTGFLQYVSLQPMVPPFDNLHVRRAVHLAADRIALQEARGGPVTGGRIATSLFPPTLAAYEPIEHYPSGPDQTGDLAAARRELALAGLPDGFDATIGTQRGKFRMVAEAMVVSLARIGIRLRIDELDVATYFSRGIGLPDTIRERRLGLVVNDWGPDFPTEYGFLAPLVHGDYIQRNGGNFNIAELDDERVNARIRQTLTSDRPGQRLSLWRELDRYVMAQAVILPVVHDMTLHYRNPWVRNVFVHPAFGLYDIQAAGVANHPGQA